MNIYEQQAIDFVKAEKDKYPPDGVPPLEAILLPEVAISATERLAEKLTPYQNELIAFTEMLAKQATTSAANKNGQFDLK